MPAARAQTWGKRPAERWRAGWVLPVSADPIHDGAVAFADGVIVDCGPAGDVRRRHGDLPERDLGHCILVPGFVDAHCHLEWSLLGGLVSAGPFAEWLSEMLPIRGRYPPGADAVAADLGAVRSLEAGTTTLADSGPSGAGAAAMARAGLRGIAALEVLGRERGRAAEHRATQVEERLARLDELATDRMSIGVAPHAPYSIGPELWSALASRAPVADRLWLSHLAESSAEDELLRSGTGPLAELFASVDIEPARWPGPSESSSVGRVSSGEGLATLDVAAHCVHVARGDAQTLAAAQVAVAHCPTSNAYLECGRAPVAALLAAGAAVGLGTDSPASGGRYDLRAEARAVVRAARAAGTPPPVAGDLLRMATRGGAEALGLIGQVGELRVGLRADLVAVTPPPDAEPAVDPAAAALDPRAGIACVAIDGETLVEGGRVMHLDRCSIVSSAAGARAALC